MDLVEDRIENGQRRQEKNAAPAGPPGRLRSHRPRDHAARPELPDLTAVWQRGSHRFTPPESKGSNHLGAGPRILNSWLQAAFAQDFPTGISSSRGDRER